MSSVIRQQQFPVSSSLDSQDVMDALVDHVLETIAVRRLVILDDHDDEVTPRGFDPYWGGAASGVTSRRLIRADARFEASIPLPSIPGAYRLQYSNLLDDLLLYGPDINDADPESLKVALEEESDRLASVLQFFVGEHIADEDRDDWEELCERQRVWVHSFHIRIDSKGAHVELKFELEGR